MFHRIATYALCLIAFVIPFEYKYDKPFRHFSKTLIPEGLHLPSFFDQKIYFYPSDLIALILGLAALFLMRAPIRKFFASRSAPYLWIVFALAIVSIIVSPLSNYPILYVRLLQLLTPLILFSYIAVSYEDISERTRLTNWLFIALASAAIIQSLIAIVQYGTQEPLGLRIFQEPTRFAGFFTPNGERWIFDDLFPTLRPTKEILRAAGTLPHANVLGGFLCASIIACYALFFYYPRFRTWIALSISIQFFAMALSYSRSALFAWALATLFWFCHHMAYRGFIKTCKDRGIQLLTLTIFASVTITGAILYKQFHHRGGFVNYEGSLASSGDALRIQYQTTALSLIEKYPLTGTGFQQLSLRAVDLFGKENPKVDYSVGTHNIYLYLAAELGLPALLAFAAFIATLLWSALSAKFTPQLSSLMAIFIAFLFIGCCDFYPLLFQQGKLIFFLTAGLLAAHSYYEIASPKKQPLHS